MNFAAINPISAQSERQCRHSTDAFMRELELWTSNSGTLSMPLNPRFGPTGHLYEFIPLACVRARHAAHGRVGRRRQKFDPICGIHGTGTHLALRCPSMSLAAPIRTRQRFSPCPSERLKIQSIVFWRIIDPVARDSSVGVPITTSVQSEFFHDCRQAHPQRRTGT